ncbi:MAG: hypothetical protein HLUCCA13_12175 [Halomonas sp. HL-48]|nr:MAG: hypothetical protein HLUCCA13_12175 [Halomonas sp. HL-48]
MNMSNLGSEQSFSLLLTPLSTLLKKTLFPYHLFLEKLEIPAQNALFWNASRTI